MVSISTVNAAQAGSYYSKDNYYTKAGGQWQGKGTAALGLSSEIEKEDFLNLIHGKDIQGNQLVEGSKANNGKHGAGVDLTFSAPKSVSILTEVLGDEKARVAHEKAVSETLKYLEDHYAQARQTAGGVTERVNTGNLVIAKFEHNTSRELDPQLHIHCVSMNMTQRPDGQWRALSNELLYDHKMFIGQMYRNELAANLKELGYSIQSDHKGLFEVRGVDEKLLEHFSQRSEQIEAKVAELNERGLYPNATESKLREIATLGSRASKQDVDMEVVKGGWAERLQGQGYSREGIGEQCKIEAGKELNLKSHEQEYLNHAAKILTENESTFSKEDLLKVAGKLSIGEHRIAGLEQSIPQTDIVKLNESYTTKEMLKMEKEIVDKVMDGRASISPAMPRAEADRIIENKYAALTRGQADAVRHILTTSDRVVGIQGDAGTGKTTMLAAAREQLEAKGYEVRGLGFTGKAAEEVEKNAGIKSQTLHSFLGSKDDISNKTILIVDEASMVGSRQMHSLIEKAESASASVVLIGDTKQLQSIGAGKMFQELQEKAVIQTVRMDEVLRQKEEGYKEIVKAFADKDIDKAFDKLDAQGKIYEIANREDRLTTIVKNYTSVEDYRQAIIVTARNADRNELNQAIRSELQTKGQVSKEEQPHTVRESKNLSPIERHFAQSYQEGDIVYSQKAGIIGRAGNEGKVVGVDNISRAIMVERTDGRQYTVDIKTHGQDLQVYQEKTQSFAEGERVVFLKNDRMLDVKNGMTGTLEKVDDHGDMHIKTDTGRDIKFNAEDYKYIDYGYAVTTYKSQGQTTSEVIYHADTDKEANYNEAYVAMTRGKEDVRVYTNDKGALKEQVQHEQEKTSTLDYLERHIEGSGKNETKMEKAPAAREVEL